MGKSLGNYYTLKDLIAKGHDPKAVRYLLLSTHYRQQLNFTFEGLESAKNAILRLSTFVERLDAVDGKGCGERIASLIGQAQKQFEKAMDEDLNISLALGALFDFVREANKLIDEDVLSSREAEEVKSLIMRFDRVLGVLGEAGKEVKLPKEAEVLLQKREEARKAKDWNTADKLREQLKAMGVIVEDTPQGQKWRLKQSL